MSKLAFYFMAFATFVILFTRSSRLAAIVQLFALATFYYVHVIRDKDISVVHRVISAILVTVIAFHAIIALPKMDF